jgi:hypothetical protein
VLSNAIDPDFKLASASGLLAFSHTLHPIVVLEGRSIKLAKQGRS